MLGRAPRRAMCASGGGAFIHVQNKKRGSHPATSKGREGKASHQREHTELVYNVRVRGDCRTCDVERAKHMGPWSRGAQFQTRYSE